MSPLPPHRRTPRLPFVAGLVALLMLAAPTPAGAAPEPGDERPPSERSVVHRVTLLTGDTVTVTELGDGRSAVAVAPQDRVSAGEIRTTTVGDDVYVVPAAAAPYLASGAFDRALFDVTGLIDQGLADEQRGTLPLIIQYRDSVRAGTSGPSAPRGSVRTRTLQSIDGSAVSASKGATERFWGDVTGRSPAETPSTARPTLRDGIVKVWLDARVEAKLADSVAQVGAPAAWAGGYDGTGVTVAVLDTGVDPDHPDLTGQIDGTRSFVPEDDIVDQNGHGTHVASTVLGTGAASGGDERGVAPGARLFVGKVLGDDGYGQDSWIIDGMEWAADHAAVVNMSLGSLDPSDGTDPMSQSLNTLSETTGTLFVVAAGNVGAEQWVSSPAAADDALSVGAVDSTDALAWFSSMGPRLGDLALKPDLVAPGMDIRAARSQYSPEGEGDYVTLSGTSMATPHVAGAAAVVVQRHPGWPGARVKDALMSTAKVLDGTTPYQTGAGRLDVAAAALGDLTATGSTYFGFDRWPHSDASPVVRTVTYRNEGEDAVTLDLAVELQDDTGAAAPDGLVTLAAPTVTVPAGGTAEVDATLDPTLAQNGRRYTGRLVAGVGGDPVAHTTLGFVKEDERYDLTIDLRDRAGEPVLGYVDLVGGPAGYDTIVVDGTTTRRLPPGTYSVSTWLNVDTDTDHVGLALLTEPEVVVDRDRHVTLDAREARPVTATAPKSPAETSYMRMSWYRKLGDMPVESDVMTPVWTDDLYATPTARVTTGEFELNTRWRFRQPMLSIDVGGDLLDVIPQAGASLFDGRATLPVVVAGQGAPADYASLDAEGALAVVVRSDAVTPYDRAVAARDAGAAMLLVVNDQPTELSEWVGGPAGEDPGIPVAAISGTEGELFLGSSSPETVEVVGRPDSRWVFDLQDPHQRAIPEDLTYAPRLRDLAEVTGEYASDRPAAGGEFRYDFRPYTLYGVGFLQSLSLPQVRHEWVSTPPGSTWYQEALVIDPTWDVRGVRAALRAGSHTTSRWFSPVVRPRLGAGYWASTRAGGYFSINLPSFADSGKGHTGDMYGVAQQHIALFNAAGRLLHETDDQAMWTAVSNPRPVRYRMVSTARRDPARWRTSPFTRTSWRFWSAEPAAGTEARLPLLSLDYRVHTDLAGRVGPGPTRLRLTAVQVPGAVRVGRVVGGRLWASYNHGRTWQAVRLRDAGAGSWTATVPRKASAHGSVSLRASAWDRRGNRVDQLVRGAYLLR